MSASASFRANAVRERALQSGGISHDAIYAMVSRALRKLDHRGTILIDVGCGAGNLFAHVGEMFTRYIGVDVVRHSAFPGGAEFVEADLERATPLPRGIGDAVVAIETIEHLENPRAFVRELARVARPGGTIAVTTPNQLSLLSKLGLLVKNQFPAFQEAFGLYPAHLTALLEIDLIRIAKECGLEQTEIFYSDRGRIPSTPLHWPRAFRGRMFSDNVMLLARKPTAA